jgi:hypothetical protein
MQAVISWGQGTGQAGPSPGSEKKLCLCSFWLGGTDKEANTAAALGGLFNGPGVVGVEHAASEVGRGRAGSNPVFNKEAQQSYEAVLKEASAFQYTSSDKLIAPQDGQRLSLADTAGKNGLFACVSAGSFWGVRPGWNKKLIIRTTWVVVGEGGCRTKIVTQVVSKDTYGKFPDGSDPKLKPFYLEMTKEDARQFLEALPRSMMKAGCTT